MLAEQISLSSNLLESRLSLSSLIEIAQLLKELGDKHNVAKFNNLDRNSFDCALGALLSLAIRNICPTANSSIQKLVETTHNSIRAKPLTFDDTNFAKVLTSISQDQVLVKLANDKFFQADFLSLFKNICRVKKFRVIIESALFVGWLNQLQNKDREDYDKRRKKKSLDEVASLTKWYTPEWIAEILAKEVLSCKPPPLDGQVKFLDPAVGAGHLLVPAFLHMVSKSNRSLADISNILENQLFGLDIDANAIRIAGFSIYLSARDIAEVHDFPLPALYSFTKESEAFGSYLLGLREAPKTKILISLTHKPMPLNIIPEKFDAIAANPPYLSNRLIPKSLKTFLKQHYKDSYYDLYTSFLELSIRLLSDKGQASFICQQSFLSIHRYEGLRRKLLKKCKLVTLAQLGKGIFATRSGEKVNSAIITLSKVPTSPNDMVSFLSKEGDYLKQSKRPYKDIEFIFNSVPGYPLAPWCPNEIAGLFKSCPPLENPNSGITLTNGLFTCNNKKFVKHFSQIEVSNRKNFVPYDKGGAKKWYYTTPYYLEWIDNGDEIRAYRKDRGQSISLPGEDYYFKPGITYSYIGPSGFKARLLSPNSIFDIASSAIFCGDDNLYYLLGFLNSSLTRYMLGILNPTVNFQIGDLRKLPYIEPDQTTKSKVKDLSRRAIDIARLFESYNCDSPAFESKNIEKFLPELSNSCNTIEYVRCRLKEEIDLARKEELEIQEEIDKLIYNLYDVSTDLKMVISQNSWVNQDTFSQIKKLDSDNLLEFLGRSPTFNGSKARKISIPG